MEEAAGRAVTTPCRPWPSPCDEWTIAMMTAAADEPTTAGPGCLPLTEIARLWAQEPSAPSADAIWPSLVQAFWRDELAMLIDMRGVPSPALEPARRENIAMALRLQPGKPDPDTMTVMLRDIFAMGDENLDVATLADFEAGEYSEERRKILDYLRLRLQDLAGRRDVRGIAARPGELLDIGLAPFGRGHRIELVAPNPSL